MAGTDYVLVLSKSNAGGIRPIAKILKGLKLRPILVSDQPKDLNAGLADFHIVIDWNNTEESVVESVDSQLRDRLNFDSARIFGVVNLLEDLMDHQFVLSQKYGNHPVSPGLARLHDKLAVRRSIAHLEAPSRWFAAIECGEAQNVAHGIQFPAIIKPSRNSGASSGVFLVTSEQELLEADRAASLLLGSGTPMIIEDFVGGIEFSLDGYVNDGLFIPAFAAEKPARRRDVLHDQGVILSPPPTAQVLDSLPEAARILKHIAAEFEISAAWFHAEFRLDDSGRPALIEVNPRPGGGCYVDAIKLVSGIDCLEWLVSLLLFGQAPNTPTAEDLASVPSVVGLLGIECTSVGHVSVAAGTVEALERLKGVVKVSSINFEFDVQSPHMENWIAFVLLGGASHEEVQLSAVAAEGAVNFTLTALEDQRKTLG